MQNSRNEYFWNLLTQICSKFLYTKTYNAPVWDVKYSMSVMNRIASCGRWHIPVEKRIYVFTFFEVSLVFLLINLDMLVWIRFSGGVQRRFG